jgi:LacI family transcriptional regulator
MTEGEGLLAGVALWGEGAPCPTGVVCGSTRLATGLLRALGALGLRVPEDVSVVVHDDELPGLRPGTFDPPLTATRSPLAQAWPHLARFLSAAVDGAPVAELQRQGEVELVERGSVLSLPSGRYGSLTEGRRGVS